MAKPDKIIWQELSSVISLEWKNTIQPLLIKHIWESQKFGKPS